ncbi:hypothetical protein F5Y08DRAFT_354050 [Xylaria arbuscula]|nr:hypothetical protein F5Y08DRAFT_354050 [Xylaria arbuscula]
MVVTTSDSSSNYFDWPNPELKFLDRHHLKTLLEDLDQYRSKFQQVTANTTRTGGPDIDALFAHVYEPCFWGIIGLAQITGPIEPLDADLIAETAALEAQLQACGIDEKPQFALPIPPLPVPEYDVFFKGCCTLVESVVNVFVMGDAPGYQLAHGENCSDDFVFHILHEFTSRFNRYPFLRLFHDRLMEKLNSTKTGIAYHKNKTEHVKPTSERQPKRKIDALNPDEDAKKSLESQMHKHPKLDDFLSSPSSRP